MPVVVRVVVKPSPSLIDDAVVETEKVGSAVTDVSAIDTDAVEPTWVERDESEKSLIFRVSVPSVVRSFVRVWEKVKDPLLETVPEPVSAPDEKSDVLIPVPLKE